MPATVPAKTSCAFSRGLKIPFEKTCNNPKRKLGTMTAAKMQYRFPNSPMITPRNTIFFHNSRGDTAEADTVYDDDCLSRLPTGYFSLILSA